MKGVGYMDEYSEPLFKRIEVVGGGFMPAGAGGMGAVCIAYLPENIDASHFFGESGMEVFDAEKAAQVKQAGGTLKGYLPFRASDESMTLSSGWEKIGTRVPGVPALVAVNQATGEVLPLAALAERDGLTLPEEMPDKLESIGDSLQQARTLAHAVNAALLEQTQ